MTGFQHITEASHNLIDHQEIPFVSAIFLLRRTQLSGEEGEMLPDALISLLDVIHGVR